MRTRVNRSRYIIAMIMLGLADAIEEGAGYILPSKGSTL